MNALQKKALEQAAAELRQAENIVLMNASKPDFGPACQRDTKAGEVMELVRSAQAWIAAVQDA